MNIDHQEIYSAIIEFLELLENRESKSSASMESLEFALDKLAFIYHFVDNVSDVDKKFSDSPVRNYSKWRELAAERFPNLGYYNIPSAISTQIGEAVLHTGDAIDDLADIANELSEIAWRWQHNSVNDALWHFRFSYDAHWGAHLRSLQMYLHAIHDEK